MVFGLKLELKGSACFDTATDMTFIDKASNFTLDPCPPKGLLEILVHLSTTRVNRDRSFMSLLQNQLPQAFKLRNDHASFKE